MRKKNNNILSVKYYVLKPNGANRVSIKSLKNPVNFFIILYILIDKNIETNGKITDMRRRKAHLY